MKDKKYLTNDFLIKLIDTSKISISDKQLVGIKSSDIVYKLYVGGNPSDFNVINHDKAQSNDYQ